MLFVVRAAQLVLVRRGAMQASIVPRLIRMVSAEGIESAQKPKFNDMQGHGWHESTRKAAVNGLTDRGWIAEGRQYEESDPH